MIVKFLSQRCVLALLILALGVVSIVPVSGGEEIEVSIVSEELPTAKALYEEYLSANGGRANIQELTTMIVDGYVAGVSGEESHFKIFRKRPNKLRLRMEIDGFLVETIYNGEVGWREVTSPKGDLRILALEGDDLRSIIADSEMEGPFFALGGRSDLFTPVEFGKIRGIPAIKITVNEKSGSQFDTIWLSQETFQEIKLERNIETVDASGELLITREEVYFSEFDQLNGVYFSRRIDYFIDSTFSRSVGIVKARANVGIFDTYFEQN